MKRASSIARSPAFSIAGIVATLVGVLGAFAMHAHAAPGPRPALEIWGALPGDVVEIDGAATTVKAGVTPRPFEGEPLPGNAAITHELAAGRHSVIVKREGCANRAFDVELQGAFKRSIVLSPAQGARCGLPAPPPRAP